MQDATSATVDINAPQGKYTLTFQKTGMLAGHVTSMDGTGKVLCDEVLGGAAQSPDGGTSGDGGPGSEPSDDAGTMPGSGGGGCGCSTPGGRAEDVLGVLLVAVVCMGRRRRVSLLR